MNSTYLTAMIESLEKKVAVLDEIINKNTEQAALLKEEEFSFEKFDRNSEEKGVLIYRLEKLDDGFESVYAKVREELLNNKEAHKDEIKKLQDLITRITEKSVKVQAAELRGKETVERFLKKKRTALKDSKSTVKAANAYAVNMRKMNKIDAFFVDKKK